jgi:superfamily II RNA helicase
VSREPKQDTLLTYLPPAEIGVTPEPDDLFEAFSYWATASGRPLYPHQEEALLEAMTGAHVIVATPTGSGKSLIAMGAQFAAFAAWRNKVGGRTFYTAPLKALVSEKFFDLVAVFGAENVGMITGDSSVNPTAPIICCTAEILANLALRQGGAAGISQVVMDEFHFYGDPERGWAWQVPLLELPNAQFLLLSATLGDTTELRADLQERSGRPVAEVTSVERPVPLEFEYLADPLPDTLERLVQQGKAPVYLVHFTQKEAVERAQALLSLPLTTKAEKEQIAAELADFNFGTGFGKTLSRFLRAGVGVHHAGMLPKYRRLVERLTKKGLLKIVCGTDTLGVGINMPLRTVVFTGLVKFDGSKSRHLSAREFHQIAGRAGRAGYDSVGEVVVMAPEHVIANRTALMKAGDDPKKLKKITRKQAPQGFVNWTEQTYERLKDSAPEALTSQFRVTHAMLLNILARARSGGDAEELDPVLALNHLLEANHDTEKQKREHMRQALRIYHSLKRADVVEKVREQDPGRESGYRPTIRLKHDIPDEFALNQTLSPFALAALDLLNPNDPEYAFNVVSLIEATLESPRQVLIAQEKAAKSTAMAQMKADGLEYDERINALLDITYPQPLTELLEPAFLTYLRTNPWVGGEELKPKSVVREMLETASTFSDYVSRYGLERAEGVLLRYLADAYRALRQVVTGDYRTPEVEEIIEWLGELVRGVDSSLLDEWERLALGDSTDIARLQPAAAANAANANAAEANQAPISITANPLAFRRLVRNAMFRLVELAAREDYAALAALTGSDTGAANEAWDADRWADALDPLFVEQGDDAIGIAANARSGAFLTIVESGQPLPESSARTTETTEATAPAGYWWVRQVFDDLDGHHDWAITALVDLAASAKSESPVIKIEHVGPM